MDSLTYEELLGVLKTAKAHSLRNWAMILTAFSHGLRASEVCQLKISDLAEGHLTIKRLKGSRTTLHQLVPHRGQPLLDEVKAMKEWLAVRPTDAGDALFPSQKGGCMTATQFYRVYRATAEEYCLPEHKRHPHVLKHTTCTELIRHDMNLAKVGAFVGHASITSTMRYVSISDDEASREAIITLMKMRA
ncbi:MAG TPA: tyrosine-type recombinase/integrase [Candidatus Dormibacteraeota bacterium]|jgi:type 1 fimbriae regulatory protein FimB|nr:tyrosine-type recombinase/integrase [Candidatus Dormibacteraeota bacterium]